MNILKLGVLTLFAFATPVFAADPDFQACRQNFYQGFAPKPAGAPQSLRALCFADFAVLHSGQAKSPVYAAEHLTPASLRDAKDEVRTNKFYEEARLPAAERATLRDYLHSGYDRGHNACAAQRSTPEAMAQSFSLANMTMQSPNVNRGLWAKSVEKATRSYVNKGNEVYVITGPIFRAPVLTQGPGRVWVPSALFKLVYDPVKHKAWAYVVDNTATAKLSGLTSYADLVKMTGTQWLPAGAVTN